jgi:hypothetical protein
MARRKGESWGEYVKKTRERSQQPPKQSCPRTAALLGLGVLGAITVSVAGAGWLGIQVARKITSVSPATVEIHPR